MITSSTSYQPKYESESPAATLPAWKVELNAKLAAHRQRAGAPSRHSEAVSEPAAMRESSAAKSSVAARVAERYAKAPSYRDFLAASAAASAAAAEMAAYAARQAQEAAEAHAQLAAASERTQAEAPAHAEMAATDFEAWPETATRQLRATVEHPEPLPARSVAPPRPVESGSGQFGRTGGIVDAIAEATVPPAVTLPAKLIEFPRELVAARKSRPRIAEGPLAAEVETPLLAEAESRSLRIFEVHGEVDGASGANLACQTVSGLTGAAVENGRQGGMRESEAEERGYSYAGLEAEERIAHPALAAEEMRSAAPEWQPIRLGEHPVEPEKTAEPFAGQVGAEIGAAAILQTASLGDRAMAALVDIGIVGIAFVLSVLVFAWCTVHPPVNRTALGSGALILAGVFVFYEWLFMSYGGDTPGMRYARIALCTFEDENPTRKMRQRRVAVSVLSALSLGLGFVWALFDKDGLGWHDRMSRSYQRSYR